jgi:hypothetical protein
MPRLTSLPRLAARARAAVALAALAVAGAAALAFAAPAPAMTPDLALDRYIEVASARSLADLECELSGDWRDCDRAVRLARGSDVWFGRYLRLSERAAQPETSSASAGLDGWVDALAAAAATAVEAAAPPPEDGVRMTTGLFGGAVDLRLRW